MQQSDDRNMGVGAAGEEAAGGGCGQRKRRAGEGGEGRAGKRAAGGVGQELPGE